MINTSMKLADLVESDFSTESGRSLNDTHFEMAFNAIKNKELDKAGIKDLAKEFGESDKFDRTADSAEFVLSRMHILIHGLAPHGETQNRAETMFTIPKTMIDFANRKGLDTFENIERAKIDLKGRPIKRKQPEATKMMADYYKANKDKLPKDIAKQRENLIKDIMSGLSPEEAFARYS